MINSCLDLQFIINNAKKAASRDGYNQYLLAEDGQYSFGRYYSGFEKRLWASEVLIGKVIGKWENGINNISYSQYDE